MPQPQFRNALITFADYIKTNTEYHNLNWLFDTEAPKGLESGRLYELESKEVVYVDLDSVPSEEEGELADTLVRVWVAEPLDDCPEWLELIYQDYESVCNSWKQEPGKLIIECVYSQSGRPPELDE